MKGATRFDLPPSALVPACRDVVEQGGRMQMAYAWFAGPQQMELRYLSTGAPRTPFTVWRVDPARAEVPSLAEICPLLSWYEREMMEMCGVAIAGNPEPYGLVRTHGQRFDAPPLDPLGRPYANGIAEEVGSALPAVTGRQVQILPFGPVRADVFESARFVFYYIGEGILHYHPQLFFKHRGIEKCFEGLSPRLGIVMAERVSGVDSVAHALAFAQAVEDAAGCEVPARARWIRTIVAELERVYNHLHYLGHLCHTTTLKVGEAQGKLLEEYAKQLNGSICGSRFLRGVIGVGGVRRDLDWNHGNVNREKLRRLAAEFETYVNLVERTTSHLDRLITTAPLSRKVAFDQGATGPIVRASGVDRDLRRDHPYAAYDVLPVNVAIQTDGDAHARMKVRIGELRASFALLDQALSSPPPDGPLSDACLPAPSSEGLGWTESTRGTLLYAVHFDDMCRLRRVKIKSPSFSNWRVFPYTVHDSNMMDYAINEASFGLTISGCAR